MKDLIKTAILLLILAIIGYSITSFNDNIEHSIDVLSKTNLDFNDPTVQVLYPRIENNTLLRDAYLDTSEISSTELIEFVLDNLTKDDYKSKKYDADKITCQITWNIDFLTNTGSCKVYIIDHSKFMEKQEEYFNTTNEIQFSDIDYHGYECRTDNEKYYCLVKGYTSNLLGYSVFDSAYEDKEYVYIREYYLQINLNNYDRCLEYLNKEYCDNTNRQERPFILEDTIKEDGVLYEHIFKKKDTTYYLVKSYVLNG